MFEPRQSAPFKAKEWRLCSELLLTLSHLVFPVTTQSHELEIIPLTEVKTIQEVVFLCCVVFFFEASNLSLFKNLLPGSGGVFAWSASGLQLMPITHLVRLYQAEQGQRGKGGEGVCQIYLFFGVSSVY